MYYKEELELLTVKELREIVKIEQYQLPGAWKAKKQELVEGILFGQEDEENYQTGHNADLADFSLEELLELAQFASTLPTTQDVANASLEAFEKAAEEQPKKKKLEKI